MDVSIKIVTVAMWLMSILLLVSFGFIVWLLLRDKKPNPKDCNHIYMLYSPTASRCALCHKEHPYSNKMPELNRRANLPPGKP